MSEFKEFSICTDAQLTLKKAREDGVETAWDRLKKQEPQCGYCELGVSCRICVMGPCRVDPFGEGPQRGVCGADAEIIVARNLARMIASGAASHSDHGRDLLEVLHELGQVLLLDGPQLVEKLSLHLLWLEAGEPLCGCVGRDYLAVFTYDYDCVRD